MGGAEDPSRGPELPNAGKDVDPKAERKALNHRIMTAGGIIEQAGLRYLGAGGAGRRIGRDRPSPGRPGPCGDMESGRRGGCCRADRYQGACRGQIPGTDRAGLGARTREPGDHVRPGEAVLDGIRRSDIDPTGGTEGRWRSTCSKSRTRQRRDESLIKINRLIEETLVVDEAI